MHLLAFSHIPLPTLVACKCVSIVQVGHLHADPMSPGTNSESVEMDIQILKPISMLCKHNLLKAHANKNLAQ